MVRTLNKKQLSDRLSAVSDQLIPNKKLVDIGTDHAYLPCYTYLKGIIPSAVGTEVNEGPFQSAQSLVHQLGLSEYIDIRFGDGLSVLHENEVEQLTIAGMGGGLITRILEEGKAKLQQAERLILQPNVAAVNVRKWLYKNDWTLIRELILEEDKIIYEIIVAEQRKDKREYDEKDFMFGPYLIKEKSATFRKKWETELKKQKKIHSNLMKLARSTEAIEKRLEIERKIQLLEEALV